MSEGYRVGSLFISFISTHCMSTSQGHPPVRGLISTTIEHPNEAAGWAGGIADGHAYSVSRWIRGMRLHPELSMPRKSLGSLSGGQSVWGRKKNSQYQYYAPLQEQTSGPAIRGKMSVRPIVRIDSSAAENKARKKGGSYTLDHQAQEAGLFLLINSIKRLTANRRGQIA